MSSTGRFAYHAIDAAGQAVHGELTAADAADALRQLTDRGWTSVELVEAAQEAPPECVPVAHLSASEAEEILGHLTYTTLAEKSLVAGLRAAAAEASSRRVADSLHFLAQEIHAGRSLTDALSLASSRMPAHVRGLVEAASRTGRLGPVLDELMEHQQQVRAMFWGIWGSLTYPLVVLGMAIAVLSFFLVWIVPQFETLFVEMDLRLPMATESLILASRSMIRVTAGPAKWLVGALAACAALIIYLSASGQGGARVQRALGMMPLCGPLWVWSSTVSFMTMLSTLLEQRVPLPEALQLAGDSMSNAEFRRAAGWLAKGVQGGQSLAELVETSGCLPSSTVPVLRWGEQSGVLAEAARTLAEMFLDRLTARTAWLRSASPPLIYLFIVVSIGFAITSLFLPLVSLIEGLA